MVAGGVTNLYAFYAVRHFFKSLKMYVWQTLSGGSGLQNPLERLKEIL